MPECPKRYDLGLIIVGSHDNRKRRKDASIERVDRGLTQATHNGKRRRQPKRASLAALRAQIGFCAPRGALALSPRRGVRSGAATRSHAGRGPGEWDEVSAGLSSRGTMRVCRRDRVVGCRSSCSRESPSSDRASRQRRVRRTLLRSWCTRSTVAFTAGSVPATPASPSVPAFFGQNRPKASRKTAERTDLMHGSPLRPLCAHPFLGC